MAYHLGNRHVPVEIREGHLCLAFDHVLLGLLEALGADAEELEAPFEPEGGAYGGGHSHGGEHAHGAVMVEILAGGRLPVGETDRVYMEGDGAAFVEWVQAQALLHQMGGGREIIGLA